MKPQFAYIPALAIILGICLGMAGFLGYLASGEFAVSGKLQKEIDAAKKSYENLVAEESNINVTEQADKSLQEYFARWYEKEGDLNPQRILEVARSIGEETQVSVADGSLPSDMSAAEETLPEAALTPAGRRMPPSARNPRTGVTGMRSARGEANTAELVLTGNFQSLMKFLTALETRLESVKITKLAWSARSSEEVRLAVTISYRVIRKDGSI